jgi:hypothetical protein
MKSKLTTTYLIQVTLLSGIICAGTAPAQELFTKPAWVQDLSLSFTEGFDDNIYGVSDNGLQPQPSRVTTITPKVGFNFAPLFGVQSFFQALSLSYAPDFVIYQDAPTESYDANKIGAGIKGSAGDFSFSLDNAFLYNDGSKLGIDYAQNQLSGKKAKQNDKYRSTFAQAMVRERRDQVQDREATVLQYDLGNAFIRPTASYLDYNMDTKFENTKKAPYLGYQNWVDRSDANGGLDLGYKVTPTLAVTVGYRYGSQYQEKLPAAITTDFHNASSTYQRLVMGLEGKPLDWLQVRLTAAPDFRDFNSNAPVKDFHPVEFYGEAAITATIATNQNVTFNYKQWQWVSSTGFVPDYESSYSLNYHWNATARLGLDLGGRIQEQNYLGDDYAGTEPSLRADRMFSVLTGLSYALNPYCIASLNYTMNKSGNVLASLPAALEPSYRSFVEHVFSVGLSYKF